MLGCWIQYSKISRLIVSDFENIIGSYCAFLIHRIMAVGKQNTNIDGLLVKVLFI